MYTDHEQRRRVSGEAAGRRRRSGGVRVNVVVWLLAGLVPVESAHAAGGGSWEPRPALNLARQELAAARIGGRVYVAGGLVAGLPLAATATVEAYDVSQSTWSFVAPLPEPRDHGCMVAWSGRLHFIGGFAADFVPRTDHWTYDPVLDQWSPAAPLPEARGAAWAVAFDGKIYVFGGQSPTGTSSTTFIYDMVTTTWSTGAPMPTAREHLNAVGVGRSIHVIGGRNGAATSAHERYDTLSDTWDTLAPLPTARSASAVAILNGRIHVAGGEIPQLFAVHETYDLTTGVWGCAAAMAIPRHGVAAITLDATMFVAGGGLVQGLAPSSATDVFVPAMPGFIRGDCNRDAFIDIADAVIMLLALFTAGASPPCADACETNDDGVFNIADIVAVLNFLFVMGPPPPPPEICGDDPTPDPLTCTQFPPCP